MKQTKDILNKECVASSYPSIIQLETTSYCNAECIMCSHYYMRNRYAKHFDFNMLSHLDELLSYAEVVLLHGVGEPFLNPDIGKLITRFMEDDIYIVTKIWLCLWWLECPTRI